MVYSEHLGQHFGNNPGERKEIGRIFIPPAKTKHQPCGVGSRLDTYLDSELQVLVTRPQVQLSGIPPER